MTSSDAQDAAGRKKHVRFARMEEEADNDDQEEDTLFDKRKDAAAAPHGAAKRAAKPGGDERVEVVGGGRRGACGRWMVTLALCASFLGLGMSISVLGPTLEDLAANVKKNISNISYIFVGRSAGYIGGSLIGGALIDCVNPHLLLGFSMLLTACGTGAIPFCKHALLLTGFMSSIGISMGVLDTGGNVLILNTWGEQAGPHLQALHFSFAAGAFAAPIVAKLVFGGDGANGTGRARADVPLLATAAPDGGGLLRFVRGSLFRSMWAYVLISLFVLATSVVFFGFYCCTDLSRDKARAASGKPLVAKHHAALVVLLFLFFFAYVGAEVAYGSFIYTFAKDYAGMPQVQAAGLNSVFWGTFAACRGLAIVFAAFVYPGTMILLSLVASTVASLLLCLFSRVKVALWICTGLYGASMATTFPSGIAWMEQYTTVTGHTASVFVVGAALGEMVLPALLGFLLGKVHDQPLLMYLSLATAVFTSVLFPVMYRLAVGPGGQRNRGQREADDSEYRRALLDSGGNEDEEEVDPWADADFEVIEMDESSPSKAPSAAGVTRSSSSASTGEGAEPVAGAEPLLSLDREGGD